MSAPRPKLALRPEACDGCDRCVEVCRSRALKTGPGYIFVDWAECDGCGKCVEFCDRGAILMRDEGRRVEADHGSASPLLSRRAGEEDYERARLWRPWKGSLGTGKPGARPGEEPAGVAWSIAEAAGVVVIAIVLEALMQVVLASSIVHSLTESGVMLARGAVLAIYYALLAVVLILLALRRKAGFASAYRLDVAPDPMSVPIGFAMLIGTWLFAMLYRLAAVSFGWTPPAADSPSLPTLFGADAVGMTITVLVVVLLGPVVEELLVRGVVLTALQERLGRWWGISLSALIFATLHGSWWSFLPLTVLGLALGMLASDRRSLWPAIALHVAYNAVIVAPAFLVR